MSQPELVRITVYNNGSKNAGRLGYVWGLYVENSISGDFLPLYSLSGRAIENLINPSRLGSEWANLGEDEINSSVPVEQCRTPKLVYGLAMKAAMEGKL